MNNTIKTVLVLSLIMVYAVSGLYFSRLPQKKVDKADPLLTPAQVRPHLDAAIDFFDDKMVVNDHIILYTSSDGPTDTDTNSEAVSYYLLWNAHASNKENFDAMLEYIEDNMLHEELGYIRWKISLNQTVDDDGSNIASDADLRAIRALLIAEEKWGDDKYSEMISTLSDGIQKVALTTDKYLAPYGGGPADDPWTADEVWLSYTFFDVFDDLREREGGIWDRVYDNMKNAVLGAQVDTGLYNTELTEQREYGNSLDGKQYSINSMWIMIRNAESEDPVLMNSAEKSLQFYKERFLVDNELYPKYTSRGDAVSPDTTPWVYALVGRAAIELDDREFADKMMLRLMTFQEDSNTEFYGAIKEGHPNDFIVGQFTMQESILTMQRYVQKYG